METPHPSHISVSGQIIVEGQLDAPTPSSHSSPPKPAAPWWMQWVPIGLTVALVLLTLVQVLIFLRQTSIIDTQAKIAMGQLNASYAMERAFIYFNLAHFIFFDTNVPNEKDADIMAEWGNSGDTPAVRVIVRAGCYRNETAVDDPFGIILKDINTLKAVPSIYGPKTLNYGGKCVISHQEIQNVNDRHIHWYFCGRATYNDIFDRSKAHTTEFCWAITRINWQSMGQTAGETVGRHNCSDEDCPKD